MTSSVLSAAAASLVFVGACLVAVLAAARRESSPAGAPAGGTWPLWRWLCLVAGCCLFVLAVWASPGNFRATHRANSSWIGGGAVGVVTSIVPVLLVLGVPVAVLGRLRRSPASGIAWRAPRPVQWLFHPLVAGPLNCILVIMVFASGWYDDAQAGGMGWLALLAVVLAGGLLTDVGLLLPGALPRMSPGMRVLWSGVDGLLDEIPGIAVMGIQSKLVGGAMWAIAQPVVLPLLAVLLVRWLQHDRELARRTDAELDELDRRRRAEIDQLLLGFPREPRP